MSRFNDEPQPEKEYLSCRKLGIAVVERAFVDCYSGKSWRKEGARYFLLSNELDPSFMRGMWFGIAQTPMPQDPAAMLMAIKRFGEQNPTLCLGQHKRGKKPSLDKKKKVEDFSVA